MMEVPLIICGPMVRRLTASELVLFVVTSQDCDFTVSIKREVISNGATFVFSGEQNNCARVQIGTQAFVNIIEIPFEHPLNSGESFSYNLFPHGQESLTIDKTCPHLLFPDENEPAVVYQSRIDSLLHGSCRKPHFASGDALARVHHELVSKEKSERPALLMMAGDQVYVDDVAGPMLVAIHQVIGALGLFSESLQGSVVSDTEELLVHSCNYYQRTALLPDEEGNEKVLSRFFAAKKKPIFTSVNAQNHLITAAEVFAMYLLSWSPVLWQLVDLKKHSVKGEFADLYSEEEAQIRQFVDDLPAVASVLAHIPTYMIFDDHDVTDDWNLTRAWEQAAYGHAFSRRIIGNALLGYWLFQGLGNHPESFATLLSKQTKYFTPTGLQNQDELINELLNWSTWHYTLNTQPKLVVLDTRTHRWRSEKGIHQPSGLMDWETLTAFQQELYDVDSVIVVSAAPVFGVKFIEAVQRIFTFFGKALMVDAENWMAHPGTSRVMLETFEDSRTPDNVTILSGDVHYSFVYDVRLRSDKTHTHIVQITCSGIKNAFPDALLKTFDLLNRWFYNRWSMFNFFTKRRRMSIRARFPGGRKNHTLYNKSAIGKVYFDHATNGVKFELICHDGKKVNFER